MIAPWELIACRSAAQVCPVELMREIAKALDALESAITIVRMAPTQYDIERGMLVCPSDRLDG